MIPELAVPDYSTLNRTIFPFLEENCLPEFKNVQLLPAEPKPGETHPTPMNVQIVTPNQWAAYDIANPEFFRLVYSQTSIDSPYSIENTPIIRSRQSVLDETHRVHDVDNTSGLPIWAEVGDRIKITLDTPKDLKESSPDSFLPDSDVFQGTILKIYHGSDTFQGKPRLPRSVRRPGDFNVLISSRDDSWKFVMIYRFFCDEDDMKIRRLAQVPTQFTESSLNVRIPALPDLQEVIQSMEHFPPV